MDNGWISFVGRSYKLVKTSLSIALTQKLPELVDRSPSNLFVIIVDMFASLMEVLNYYIDSAARELYIQTARRLSSLLRIAELFNYNGKAKIPSMVELIFTLLDANGDPIIATSDVTIPINTRVSDMNNRAWLTSSASYIKAGFSSAVVKATQTEIVSNYLLGTSNGLVNQEFNLPSDYAHGSIAVTINGLIWGLVDSFNFSLNTDKHFQIRLTTLNQMVLVFGDGVNGAIPVATNEIRISYRKTLGYSGNVPANYINVLVDDITTPTDTTLSCDNPDPSYGGGDLEDIDKLRRAIPISLYSLNRAVTRKDFEYLTSIAPGVRIAKLEHNMPKYPINIYVVPTTGGIATSVLLDSVKSYLSSLSMIGPIIDIRPSGESKLVLKVNLIGEYGSTSDTILADVKVALSELYHPQRVPINKPILTSEIVATLHNLNSVGNVNLDYFYLTPYLRPSVDDIFIEYDIEILETSTREMSWTLILTGGNTFNLVSSGVVMASFPITDLGVWKDNLGPGYINLRINSVVGDFGPQVSWSFKTYPYSKDIYLSDFTIPVMDIANSEFIITEFNG